MRVCTTATRSTLPRALRLGQSLTRHNPAAELLVLVLDARAEPIDAGLDGLRIIRADELGLDDFELLAGRLDQHSLTTAVQPALMRFALSTGTGEPIVYLDRETEVFADLSPLAESAQTHGLVLVPRFVEPIPFDGVGPTDADALDTGVFDSGCIACAPSERTHWVLAAWTDRLRNASPRNPWNVFTRWHDLLVTLMPGAAIVDDPGIGVSVWNLHERRVTRDGNSLVVGQGPLRTLSFAGLGDHPRCASQPVLSELVAERAAALGSLANREGTAIEYGFRALADGTALTPHLRHWIWLAQRYGGIWRSPFTPAGTVELKKFLLAGSDESDLIPRLWRFVYEERGDLKEAFTDIDGQDGPRFLAWIEQIGERDDDLPADLRITARGGRTA